MSYDPFDGVLLDDPRPPVPGALGIQLHLRVARRLHPGTGLDALRFRAQACRELLAHGLFPATLRGLRPLGLDFGNPRAAHSLGSLVAHLEAYLEEVEGAGFIEPDAALWQAVDRELNGVRGFWIERTAADGPITAGLPDLSPARLRALACVPALGGASFRLATRKGGGPSGLFGSAQPLVEWFLDGLEQHGQALPNELALEEPEGWGEAPWAGALEGLFEGPLDLESNASGFQRGLVDSPLDLLRHAVEQVCAWRAEGLRPRDITVVHPSPQSAAPFLAPLLAAEGIELQVRGGLRPLLASAAWSTLWALFSGLRRQDPCEVAAGLRVSRRDDVRRWADLLAQADQNGPQAFQESFIHLDDRSRAAATALWRELNGLRQARLAARAWADRIEGLAGSLRLPLDPEDFFPPLGLLKEIWDSETWTFADLLLALEAFLDAARSAQPPRAAEGLRLVAPDTLLDDWSGSRATLILDLSEGAWPARAADNPDLDGHRQAAINRALLAASAAGEALFPPALQRFWLPRSEHGDQIPRSFQRDAYAFNKALALTRERLLVLSPSADAAGRPLVQGPFWNALEGAAAWQPQPDRTHSRWRWQWEGHAPAPRPAARAAAALARPVTEALQAGAPDFDLVPDVRAAWLKGPASPTALEGLARCPFRSLAERVWGLGSHDAASRFSMAVGILAHHVLEDLLLPHVGIPDWPAAFLAAQGLDADSVPEDLLPALRRRWEANRDAWLVGLGDRIPEEQWPLAVLELEDLLPNLGSALLRDARSSAPEGSEVALLHPSCLSPEERAKGRLPASLQRGWTRTLLALEGVLGPLDLDLGGGRSLAVAGKVDRLERWQHADGLDLLRVTDYKTSKEARLKAFAEPDAPFTSHLQMPLYMLLAEAAHPGGLASTTLLPLREEDPEPFTRHLAVLAEAGDWRARLRQNLAGFDARLERGDFPPTPGEHCARCQLGALCGRPVDVCAERDEEGD